MWKHFLRSIGLLAVAFAAALYSSIAAGEERRLAAAVSALAALGIAGSVGVRFVPRLAAHVDWEWLPLFSHYRVTREGWLYFASLTVVVFAALNTANNLLYMVLSALLAVLALSGWLSALNFRLVRMLVQIPARCYAGEPFPIRIQAYNGKWFFPTFSISVEPATESAFRFSPFYVPLIRARDHVAYTGQALVLKRGRYRIGRVRISSRYPFAFFLKQRDYPADAECICYPEIVPVEQMNLSSLDLRGRKPRFQRGAGHELYTIRDYVPSDSARHVHWKASAKAAALKTREYAAEESRRVTLAFDRFGQRADQEKFEQLVSHAASLAWHLAHEGTELDFIADDWRGSAIEPILEYLALVDMSEAVEPPVTDTVSVTLSLRGA
jgi:uncharacterized protein (DUF58 family)